MSELVYTVSFLQGRCHEALGIPLLLTVDLSVDHILCVGALPSAVKFISDVAREHYRDVLFTHYVSTVGLHGRPHALRIRVFLPSG